VHVLARRSAYSGKEILPYLLLYAAYHDQAGAYEPAYLTQAVNIFENILSFGNHLHMFSEEIAHSGEQLGNTPQAFSHLALISAAFNLDRILGTR
jgi:GH15 family glucan-1,4-alpha-glucosidase